MKKPIRVFVDARTARPGMTGVGRYTLELIRGLAGLIETEDGPDSIRAAILPESLSAIRAEPGLANVEWVPVPWDYQSHPSGDFALRFRIGGLLRPDEIYHGPAYMLPTGRQPFPRVLTIHDMSVFNRPRDYPWRFGAYLRWMIRRSAAAADRIIVPTHAVAADVVQVLPVVPPKIFVIPDAPSRLCPSWDRKEQLIPGSEIPKTPYVLSIGTLEPRKDPLTAVKALEQCIAKGDAIQWLWVGSAGFRSDEILRAINLSPAASCFQWIKSCGDAALHHLLVGAAALVYPSLDEGFGLPPLEAMAAGIPTIVSDLPSLREVCGDAALYFPPGDAEALAALARRILREPVLRDSSRKQGLDRAAQFSWKRAARETTQLYQELAG